MRNIKLGGLNKMKDIISVESKRILGLRNISIIFIIILIYSIYSSILSLKNYDVYDSSRNIIISSKENLKESKKDEYKILLDEKVIKDVVERKDKSKYLYNSVLVTLIGSNYDKNIEELTDEDISNFYNNRIATIKAKLAKRSKVKDIEKLDIDLKNVSKPIQLGYAEGWKNLNNDMTDFVTVITFFIPFLLLSIFGEDSKSNMKQLYMATKYGKSCLVKSRVITAIGVGTIIYFIAVGIFSLCKLFVFGFEGDNLPIQNSINNFISIYNITFFEQYIINVIVGYFAMLVLVGMTLLTTILAGQIISSAAVVTFLLTIMTMLPNHKFEFNHYFKNFLPYHMTDFNRYYVFPEIYTMFGNIVPTYIMVIIVAILIFIILIGSTVVISNKKISKGWRI